jgi:hypothetical protein
MKNEENNFFGGITARDLLTWLCCAAVAYTGFSEADVRWEEKLVAMNERVKSIEDDVQYLVRERMKVNEQKKGDGE